MGSGLSTQAAKAPLSDRGNDLYETPPVAVRALLKAEKLPHRIWEPACGPGSIVKELREAGHDVLATDLVDYQSPHQDQSGFDFLMHFPMPEGIEAIVTNPPFKNAHEFIVKAIEVAPVVAMLLRLVYFEGQRRREIFEGKNLARVHVFRNRLPMMHRAGQGTTDFGKKSSNAIAYAWFVWDRSHTGATELHRISWT